MKSPNSHPYGGLILAALTIPFTASAEPLSQVQMRDNVSKAALRFAVPEAWIYAVIHIESRGKKTALSPKGAMGLMQLMPATWASLRQQFNLGSNPFDPHDNIMAGTAYLRYLLDRYGEAGVFAAYNAGPGRFEDYVHRGRTLPAETLAYVKSLHETLALAPLPTTKPQVSKAPPLRPEGAIFVNKDPEQAPMRLGGFSAHQTPFVTSIKSGDEP
jgi:soluble lytic murein transglycosylase-like protein